MSNTRLDYEKPARRTIISAIMLAVFSIFAQYDLPVLSYGIWGILLCCLALWAMGGYIYFNKSILAFVLFSFVQQFIIYIYSGTLSDNLNTYFFMVVCLFILSLAANVNSEDFAKAYYIIAVICGIIVLYQFFMDNIMGVPQQPIQFLPISEENQFNWKMDLTRASGLFTEPQAFSSYILPLLIYLLFNDKYKSAIFFTIVIFASESSQGIILTAFFWVYFLVKSGRLDANKLIKILSVIIGAIVLAVILSQTKMFAAVFEKIGTINIFGYDIRLTKGFQIFFAMPFFDKLFGIGFGNLAEYLKSGGFHFWWMPLTQPQLLGYVTTMAGVLIHYGIIGFVIYINIFLNNKKSRSGLSKALLLLIFISSFSQTILFNAWFIFYWVVFEIFDDKDFERYYILYVGFNTERRRQVYSQ